MTTLAAQAPAAQPDHVPADLVFDFDFYGAGQNIGDPLKFSERLDGEGAPPVFFTLRNGGHWVFRKYADVRDGYGDSEHFSTQNATIPYLKEMPLLLPQGVDPPGHQRYRRLLNPLFSPAAINRLQDWIRASTAEMLDEIAPRGHCDFVEDFAAKLPTGVFLKLMGLPLEDLPQFLIWEQAQFRGPREGRPATFAAIIGYLMTFLQEKQKNPTDDIASFLLQARDDDGEPFKFDEVLSMSLLLFMAGLDTVTNTMTSIWLQLAQDSKTRRVLVDHPERRVAALDELLRVHAMANLSRVVKEDVVIGGAHILKGDRVLLLTHRANRDDTQFADPLDTLLDRRPRDILTFGWGAHRCVGSLLARNEIKTALDEWLIRIPDFAVTPGTEFHGFAGQVMGLSSLPLSWSPSAPAAA